MDRLFVAIYDFFARHKVWYWVLLVVSIACFGLLASRLDCSEDITDFFPDDGKELLEVFDNMKAKDRISVMFSVKAGQAEVPERMNGLVEAAAFFRESAEADSLFACYADACVGADVSMLEDWRDFIYSHLPVFLSDHAFLRLDSLLMPGYIDSLLETDYSLLFSPMGSLLASGIYQDPFGIGNEALAGLQSMSSGFDYVLYDGHVFSPDRNTLLCHVDPKVDANGKEARILMSRIDALLESVESRFPDVQAEYYGSLPVAVGNAAQVKRDALFTVGIALLLVVALITVCFRNKWSIVWVLVPVAYGGLSAMAFMYLVKGSISLIAMGSGAVVLGIALSYSMHVLAHTNHCHDMRDVVKALAAPLTIGSFTTIGAFLGLQFTTSALLQDFGLFAAFALIGTTVFSLVFLPHLISPGKKTEASRLLDKIGKVASVRLDNRPVLLLGIGIVSLVCLFFYQKVGFDSDMMNLNYESKELQQARTRLESFRGEQERQSASFLVFSDTSASEAAFGYSRMCSVLDSLASCAYVDGVSSVASFVIPQDLQEARIARWNGYWTDSRKDSVLERLAFVAGRLGFETGAFSAFEALLDTGFVPVCYGDATGDGTFSRIFSDWISAERNTVSFMAQIRLPEDCKQEVYSLLAEQEDAVVMDRAFFAGLMAEDVNYNFNLILAISGILVFVALLVSYGRIELVLMLCLPMVLTWVVILGIMALTGMEFNIVTIILSTFIFGIGDDFSIFVMDGMLEKYRDGADVLSQHKTAIVFSAFTMLAGMGSLVFARHPAMHSLGGISLLGILVVLLMVYTVLPFVFRLFIASPAAKGGFPWTMASMLNSAYAFGLFFMGCIIIQSAMLLTFLFPVGRCRRRQWIQSLTSWSSHAFLKAMVSGKMVCLNPSGEDFSSPAMVVANHQSFIDILLLMGLHRKFVMMTNSWVWKSPVFGRIIRYLGFLYAKEGYDKLLVRAEEKVRQGYSILVFPEGTRSKDGKVGRFHKGAFYLAEQMKLDIVPVVLYGNGLVSSKKQAFYIKKGLLVSKILPRIPFASTEYGSDYVEKAKRLACYVRSEYGKLYEEYNRPCNFYFKDALMKNYIYKGPVLEWYMRVKCRMEDFYASYDRYLPRAGMIVDLGCGYGAMAYMLGMLSERRTIVAVDYDPSKVALANHCYSRNSRIGFYCADVRTYDMPEADAFVLSDVLHYFPRQDQARVINRCIDKLKDGGMILVREGDSLDCARHEMTKRTEVWSTKILHFNKTDGELCFLSREELNSIAEQRGFSVAVAHTGTYTSNTLFVLKRKD